MSDSHAVLTYVDRLNARRWTQEMSHNTNNGKEEDFESLKRNIANMLVRMKQEVDREREKRRGAELRVETLESELVACKSRNEEMVSKGDLY